MPPATAHEFTIETAIAVARRWLFGDDDLDPDYRPFDTVLEAAEVLTKHLHAHPEDASLRDQNLVRAALRPACDGLSILALQQLLPHASHEVEPRSTATRHGGVRPRSFRLQERRCSPPRSRPCSSDQPG